MKNKNYGIFNLKLIDNIIKKKRLEMFELLIKNINNSQISSFLDIGTTEDNKLESSNFFLYKFQNVQIKKSISDQNIKMDKLTDTLKKSITSEFSDKEISSFKSDLVISSATIEHVGSFENQKKMIGNIIKLTNKFFLITTPNRFFPVDFHTKIPLIHMFPKSVHRRILKLLGLRDYAKEENLNLLDLSTIKKLINDQKNYKFKIKILKIKLFGLTSNLLIFGEKNDIYNNSSSI